MCPHYAFKIAYYALGAMLWKLHVMLTIMLHEFTLKLLILVLLQLIAISCINNILVVQNLASAIESCKSCLRPYSQQLYAGTAQ